MHLTFQSLHEYFIHNNETKSSGKNYFPLIRHGPYRKRRLQQFFLVSGTCLPSHCLTTTGGIHIQTHGLMGGICEARRWGVLRCHDTRIHTKFNKVLFCHSQVDWRGDYTRTHTYSHRQQCDLISALVFFFQNKKSRRTRSSRKN
jgi:hypothetical protein